MKKYFHELSKDEFNELVKKKYTWGKLAEDYPQPKWCNYPNALEGEMGCWSLVGLMIKSENDCQNCDLCKSYEEAK